MTLAYFQDALDIAEKLKTKIDNMPLVVRAMLEENNTNLDIGRDAIFVFIQSINYLEQLIDCFKQEQPL